MIPYFKAGTLPVWRHPILLRKRLSAIDSLSGTYYTDRTTVLNPGDAVPGYPGMIIMDLDPIDTGVSIAYGIQAEGSLDNTLPTKTLQRSESRSIGASFESFQERKVSWLTARQAITGVASTDVISTASAHGLSDGARICLLSLTGGSGLTSQSLTQLAPVYWVRDATSTTFKVSATSGGSAVDFTTDITAGYFMVAEFCPGTPHPNWPNMYLTECRLSDSLTPWREADCVYAGKMWDKPYHRVITVNGQQINSSEKVALSGLVDGDSSLRYRAVDLPEIVITDTYVDTDALPTAYIPSSHSETGGTPPNPPSLRSLSITGTDDELVYQWPNGWSLTATQNVETLNSGIPLTIYAKVYRYKWPTLPR
jgi:hypothetical protein